MVVAPCPTTLRPAAEIQPKNVIIIRKKEREGKEKGVRRW
jgi:hypothetical protein